MNAFLDLMSLSLISIGCFVMFSASLGLYRFPDIYMRLHSTSKVNTGGVMTILVGVILRSGISAFSAKIFIILILIFILTPVVSHAIARSAHLHGKTPIVPFDTYPKSKHEHHHDYIRRKQ